MIPFLGVFITLDTPEKNCVALINISRRGSDEPRTIGAKKRERNQKQQDPVTCSSGLHIWWNSCILSNRYIVFLITIDNGKPNIRNPCHRLPIDAAFFLIMWV